MGNKIQYPKPNTLKNLMTKQLLAALVLAISTGLLVIFTKVCFFAVLTKPLDSRNSHVVVIQPLPQPVLAQAKVPLPVYEEGLGVGLKRTNFKRETPSHTQIHPLPPTLTKWEDSTNSGDYFSQVTKTEVGYLVWSKFPVKVYIKRPTGINHQQAQVWVDSVLQTVQEWNDYLPLKVVEQPEIPDITIERKTPPLEFSREDKIPRARSALTRYELYTRNDVLLHRFSILLSPSQAGRYLLAASRHELGHALGIWGHSPIETDALYFSQVRNSPPISTRDVNTLKRVYQQPTSLGWALEISQK
ncbi:peptidase [Nostoc sp. UHCC 0870]|uniref:peptidase n=1 Tax=Nostoc sp. UHCC 0870 TaxID=2914041 RepID=UPI001EDD4D3C|nr:peptidase [Nostoc sp. UHCC 0870]UKO98870.1 peptidase [Nostoc sp. UHCC 0870]